MGYGFRASTQPTLLKNPSSPIVVPPGVNPYLSPAFLLAEQGQSNDQASSNLIGSNSSIWHESELKDGSLRIGSVQIRIQEPSGSQVSSTQVSCNEVTLDQACSTEVSFTQVSPVKGGLQQISSTEIGATQVSSGEANGIIQPAKISTTQIASTQIHNPWIAPTEISFPSSVTSEQLFFIHNSDSNSNLIALNHTAFSLWQGFQPNFDLILEIRDLPTGQLAEATITSFDPTGRPNSGTLYLDANGLGWFIDPTPWDNSEYSQTLTDTAAYRATADSVAYGHYDLLTTLLHETAHLQGFIAGYSNYDSHIQSINGSKTFVGDSFSAILTPDGSHLNSQVYLYDLMNTTLTPGVRKLPSALDIAILINNPPPTPNPSTTAPP